MEPLLNDRAERDSHETLPGILENLRNGALPGSGDAVIRLAKTNDMEGHPAYCGIDLQSLYPDKFTDRFFEAV